MSFEFGTDGRSYYVPSAFYISAAQGVLDENGMPLPNGWHRLMHEYAHLIQDRTSVFGAIEFIHFFDSLQSVLKLLKAQDAAVTSAQAPCATPNPSMVQLPLSASPNAADSWIASIHKLQAATNPRKPWKNGVHWAFVDYRVDHVQVWYEGAQRNIPVAVACFVNNLTNDTYEHEIGPREIKEAYSVAVEVLHGGPEVANAKAFEYLAIERILDRAGHVNAEQIVAICHWALQDSVPGARFCEIVKCLEKNGSLPTANDLYDVLRERALTAGLADKADLVDKQLDEIVRIQSASGSSDLLFQVLRWYRDQIVSALKRNMDSARRFPLDTYLCGPGPHPDAMRFQRAVEEEPIPVVETPSMKIFAFGGNNVDSNAVLFLRSLSDLVSRLWSESSASWPCIFEPTCKLSYRDDGCKTRPCDKGSRRPVCPYGAAAAYMGFPNLRTLP